MLLWPVFASPFVSEALLYDSNHAVAHEDQQRRSSRCDELKGRECIVTFGCRWVDDSCKVRIAWMHVMKCGSSLGTTLAHFANDSLPSEAHIPSGQNQSDPEDTTKEGLEGEPNFFTLKYPVNKWFKDMFRNPENPGTHQPLTNEEYKDWKGNWVAMFREPFSRAFSAYNHFANRNVDLLSYARNIRGQQASFLSAGERGMDKIRCEFHRFDADHACYHMAEPNVTLAIQRLDGFAFVGITEHFDESICLFHKMFGSKCHSIEFMNQRPGEYKYTKEEQERMMAELKKQGDEWDVPFYEAATRRFWSDVMKYDVRPSTCRQLCPGVSTFESEHNASDVFDQPDLASSI